MPKFTYISGEKALTFLLCMAGIGGVAYGMVNDNNVIFIIGLLFVIGGYLLIRRSIKDSIRNKP